ncbi:bifunctional UDP-N-acetylglucosamine diphosphorylase/glucosamine-1-phosphate N-acetyltransferase GlmU [Nakamurella antarctica]|uniref:Bifunctional protein GlmU n=1 Tax=Nakamurella antarctica TaxID=1902245 RepID=A0A3G8ZKG8_9ACTN|nr:bifunctional UDP-N-acetylglucosamine diphosphorylase/glucosamine-1-phosphate N-acetyltransferase GlmU [Nakamurella antarctica]AZI57345.1 bifunctional UDP-N-acetylglucosamine diphosphorylase/glucosamine-1-phosphate N-acetyltransferase GlmU [Nakamurella antarctica]
MPVAETPKPHASSSPSSGDSPQVSAVVVLAAGAGTRMKSALPKVMHEVAGRSLLGHALAAAKSVKPEHLIAVIGHGREVVGEFLRTTAPDITVAIQHEQLGTGHAVACALAVAEELSGTVIVTYGDVPLLRGETLQALARAHSLSGNAVTVLTAMVENPYGYGRIIRDAAGELAAIIEQKDADSEQQLITEINSGVYAFDAAVLADGLTRLTVANNSGERYLTDVVAIARGDGRKVGALVADDAAETEGVNDRVQLAEMARQLNERLVRRAQLSGVTILDPATTWIHAGVQIGPDTQIKPHTCLEAGTVIGSHCVIGPDTTLSACIVEDGATIVRTQATGAVIGAGASVGPFSFLRPGAVLGAGSKVGAFVEVKNTTIGAGSKVPHLSYIGDATIGADSNIGAGTITANYDGVHKYPTVVGARAFVGTHTTLIAPVTIGDGAYTAAGSAISESVQPGDLGIARSRQTASQAWVLRRHPDTPMAKSARAAGALDPNVTLDATAVPGEDAPA